MSTKDPTRRAWQVAGALRLLVLTAAFVFVCGMPDSVALIARLVGL